MQRLAFNDDHLAFAASVRQFLDRSVIPNVEHYIHDKSLPRQFWLDAGAQGFLGLEIPEKYVGSEAADFRFNAVLSEELAKVNMALPSCVGIHTDIGAPYLVNLTTDEQRKRWLPGIASGEIVAAIGMTEPSGGSDLAALRTIAARDGNEWVINGSKTFITNGSSADLVIVAARTSPEKRAHGITLFGVEASRPGFSRGRKLDKVGQEEADTSELFFENVRVTDAEMIGELDRGFIHMMENLPQERLICAVANLAHCRQILLETLEYAKERKAFGQTIGSFQHNKFVLAELTTKVEVAQALRPAVWRIRLHEGVPRRACVARCSEHGDLGGVERNHEGAHRPGLGAVMVPTRVRRLRADLRNARGCDVRRHPTSAHCPGWGMRHHQEGCK